MGFKGLVISDAMNMGGITKHYKPEEANVKAFIAGNDILLMPHNVPKTISLIQLEKAISHRVKSMKGAEKYWLLNTGQA